MTQNQILSALLAGGVFTAYAVLIAAALVGFYFTGKGPAGRPAKGARWFFVAVVFFVLAEVPSFVWAAPAENSFVNPITNSLFDPNYERFFHMIVGAVMAALGFCCLVIGALAARSGRRRIIT